MKKQILLLVILSVCGCGSASSQIPSYLPSNGLVGWWPFNGNANDESGNNLNQTVIGPQLSTDRFNNQSASFSFNGLNDYMERPPAPILNLIQDSSTISAWIFLQDTPTALEGGTILARRDFVGNPNGERNQFQFSVSVNRELSFSFNNNTNLNLYQGDVLSAVNSVPIGQWCHVSATFLNGLIKLYLNGNLITSENLGYKQLPVYNHWLNFGRVHRSQGDPFFGEFKGRIDDIGLWNRALSPLEIKYLFLNCSKSITQQPVNQGMFSGNALFTCASNDTLLTYQWQSNSGMGWTKLSDVGQYTGSNSDSLKVNNISSANNKQTFRCIIKGDCIIDTTQEATLSVWGLSINGAILPEFKLYPNPSSDFVTISYSQNPYSISVYNSLGQMVSSQNALRDNYTIDLCQWAKGVYYVELIDSKNQTNKFQKLIKN